MRKTFKSLGLSFIWMLLTAFFGLFKILLDLLLSFISHKPFEFNSYFLEGILLWFITAIIAAVLIDFWMSTNNFNKLVVILLMGLFPLILFVTSIVTLYEMNKEYIANIDNLITVQSALLFSTFLYVIIAKAIQFNQDKA